jgi:hypothetical protein
MPQYANKEEVASATKKLLVGAGVQEDSAEYLAGLYADSDRGKRNVKGSTGTVVPASSCNIGIVPIG